MPVDQLMDGLLNSLFSVHYSIVSSMRISPIELKADINEIEKEIKS